MSSHRSPIRVCLIEDDPFYRAKLERLLQSAAGLQCDGSFGDAESALPHVLSTRPDIVVLDFGLPGMSGAECLERIKQRAPQVRVVVLTGIPGQQVVFDSLLGGADGFLDKERLAMPRLLEELREVHAGRHTLSRRAQELALEAFREYHATPCKPKILTPREYEVVLLMEKGYTNERIAREMGISIHTVNTHIEHIFTKTDARNRVEALLKLAELRRNPSLQPPRGHE